MTASVPYTDLTTCDLVTGSDYLAGASGGLGEEPLGPLLKVGNMGGIRFRGSIDSCELVVLYSTMSHSMWKDRIDQRSGAVTYHGDNEKPGELLGPKGNRLLRSVFERGFADEKRRGAVPPFFVFTRASEGAPPRSVRFAGVAVAGAVAVPEADWLVAKWYQTPNFRFENYTVTLTLLDIPVVPRSWIDKLATDRLGTEMPAVYRHWVETGQRRSSGTVG